MIRARLIELRERRATLVAQAGTQRESVIAFVERAEVATAWLDQAASAGRWLRERPLLVAAAVMLLAILRPRRTLKWLAAGFSLWRSWKSLRGFLRQLATDAAPARGGFHF